MTWSAANPAASLAADSPFEVAPSTARLQVRWHDDGCEAHTQGVPAFSWRLGQPPELSPEAYASQAWRDYTRYLMHRTSLEFTGGGTLHASAGRVGSRSLVFCGASGAGKSTLYGHFSPEDRILDEICDLRLSESRARFALYPDAPPVAAVCLPVHSDHFELVPVPPVRALHTMLPEVYPGLWFGHRPEAVVDFLSSLLETVPVFELHTPKDPHVVQFLREFWS